ncbi:MAG: metallophosphoesterase [Bacilli bacterium]|nr:metallophosphoesterase [Bacilli bacterium]
MRSDRYKKEEPIEEEPIKKEKKEKNKKINKKIEEEQEEKTPNRIVLFIKNFLITLVITVVLLFVYSHFIEPSLFKVNEYKIESANLPESFDGIKIVHITDTHYGTTFSKKDFQKLIKEVEELNPDIIFFTGDLIDKNIEITEKEFTEISSILKELSPSLNKYAVLGDEDNDKNKELLINSNFTILDNEYNLLHYKGTIPIEIVGFNNKNNDYSIIDNETIKAYDSIYKIILVHDPNQIDEILNYNPDLILCGHTLGGTINIKGIKKIFTKNVKYDKSYYHINNTDIYISNGLGTSEYQIRINNIPSINFYRLYKTF